MTPVNITQCDGVGALNHAKQTIIAIFDMQKSQGYADRENRNLIWLDNCMPLGWILCKTWFRKWVLIVRNLISQAVPQSTNSSDLMCAASSNFTKHLKHNVLILVHCCRFTKLEFFSIYCFSICWHRPIAWLVDTCHVLVSSHKLVSCFRFIIGHITYNE